MVGLEGVKNHTARLRIIYQSHITLIGKYSTLKGHNSQFVSRRNTFLSIRPKINEVHAKFLITKDD
jgi:hypothetical protein